MAVVIERMAEALNRHDIEAFVECFDPSYRSAQPAHPNREFGGKEQVRKNWSGMFESFPTSRHSCFATSLMREWCGVSGTGRPRGWTWPG
jgi:ketosteroid isomerase-like protein